MLVFKLIMLSVILMGLGIAGMGITILLKKNGKFPETKVGHNREMRKRKIYCVNTQEKIEQKKVISIKKLELQKLRDDEELLVFQNEEETDLGHVSLLSN